MVRFSAFGAVLLCWVMLWANGCAHPQVSNSNEISPDDEPLQSGITSGDVRSVASKMCPSILAIPEIVESAGVTRIKIADFKNNSRFFLDRNLFMKRLTLELNRNSRGKIRFLNDNEKVQRSRREILKNRQSEQIAQCLKQIASEIAASPVFKQGKIVKIAIIPVFNTNLVNMNADSFTAMLRSEIFNTCNGRVQFLMPGTLNGADYFLTGQFIPETMKTEGIINLTNYIEVIDARVKSGKSMYITSEVNTNTAAQITTLSKGNLETTTVTPGQRNAVVYENYLRNILNDPAMRANPNVNKRLNIMVIDAKTKTGVYEKMVMLDRKISDNSGAARFIISGEISGMHQRKNGVSSDYLMISVQLTDPESNETVWEDAYEVKRMSISGIVYR